MQTFRNIFKAVSGKSLREEAREVRSNKLTENVFTGLTRLLKHIENQAVLPRDLYKEPGFIDEVSTIESLVDSGKISEAYLETVRSTHSIAMAIVNVLSAHDPIIPQSLYDHFMSPMANIDALIDGLILKSPIFDQMMAHLRKVLNDKNVNISSTDIATCVGIHMLRAVGDDAGFDSQTFESQARIRTFEKILMRYIAGKEESERFFASANTANRRSSSLNVPLATTDAPTGARVNQTAPEPSPVAPAAVVQNLGTNEERSAEVIFSDPDSKPSQDELRTLLSRYGVFSNDTQVVDKEKLVVVVFASKAEAQVCARDQDGEGLGEDFKVTLLDPAPYPVPAAAAAASAPGASIVSDVLPSESPSKLYAYQDGNIKHYTSYPDSKPAVIDIPAENATDGALVARRPSLEPRQEAEDKLKTSVPSPSAAGRNEVTGCAHSNGSSAPHDTSAPPATSVLNSSLVSEFSPPDPAREDIRTSGETIVSTAPVQQHRSITESASAACKEPQHSATDDNAQNLTVQDLSMLCFSAEPNDLDESRCSDPRPLVTAAQTVPARAVDRRAREHSDSGDGSASEEGEAAEEYPLAPGSADSLHWPTRAVSAPKPGPGLVQAGARGAAMRMDSTGSSNGSWKSAQLTRSETATYPASGVRTKLVPSEPARGTDEYHFGTDLVGESASEIERVQPLPMKQEIEDILRQEALQLVQQYTADLRAQVQELLEQINLPFVGAGISCKASGGKLYPTHTEAEAQFGAVLKSVGDAFQKRIEDVTGNVAPAPGSIVATILSEYDAQVKTVNAAERAKFAAQAQQQFAQWLMRARKVAEQMLDYEIGVLERKLPISDADTTSPLSLTQQLAGIHQAAVRVIGGAAHYGADCAEVVDAEHILQRHFAGLADGVRARNAQLLETQRRAAQQHVHASLASMERSLSDAVAELVATRPAGHLMKELEHVLNGHYHSLNAALEQTLQHYPERAALQTEFTTACAGLRGRMVEQYDAAKERALRKTVVHADEAIDAFLLNIDVRQLWSDIPIEHCEFRLDTVLEQISRDVEESLLEGVAGWLLGPDPSTKEAELRDTAVKAQIAREKRFRLKLRAAIQKRVQAFREDWVEILGILAQERLDAQSAAHRSVADEAEKTEEEASEQEGVRGVNLAAPKAAKMGNFDSSTAEQRRRAAEWAAKEFGTARRLHSKDIPQPKPNVKSVEQQRADALAYAQKLYGEHIGKLSPPVKRVKPVYKTTAVPPPAAPVSETKLDPVKAARLAAQRAAADRAVAAASSAKNRADKAKAKEGGK